jgi:hypothetical protein
MLAAPALNFNPHVLGVRHESRRVWQRHTAVHDQRKADSKLKVSSVLTVAGAVAGASLRGHGRRGIVTRQASGWNSSPEFNNKQCMKLGVQEPVGLWDPLGLMDENDVETFRRRREVEFKHGRVAMLATIGYIVPEYFRWPGYCVPSQNLKFADVPNGLKACSTVPAAGWLQIIFFCGYVEFSFRSSRGEMPGDYNWKAIRANNPLELKNKLNVELANGRLAMMAIMGMFWQDGLTGSAWGDWSLYTDSPLRAAPMAKSESDQWAEATPCSW